MRFLPAFVLVALLGANQLCAEMVPLLKAT